MLRCILNTGLNSPQDRWLTTPENSKCNPNMKVWKMMFLFKRLFFSGSILIFWGGTGSSCSRCFPPDWPPQHHHWPGWGGGMCQSSYHYVPFPTPIVAHIAKFCLQPSSAGDLNKKVLVFFGGWGWEGKEDLCLLNSPWPHRSFGPPKMFRELWQGPIKPGIGWWNVVPFWPDGIPMGWKMAPPN